MTTPKIELVEELARPPAEPTLDDMRRALLDAQQFAAAKVGSFAVVPTQEPEVQ